MWGSLSDRLAGLGDAITQGATAAAHTGGTNSKSQNVAASGGRSSDGDTTTTSSSIGGGTMVNLPPKSPQLSNVEAADGIVDATSDVQDTPAAALPRWASNFASSLSDKQGQQAMLGSLRNWTTSIAESTKHIVEEAQRTIEKEQARIQATAPSLFSRVGGEDSRPYKRDLGLPLDVEALRDAEVVYITDRIVTLSHPHMQSTTDGDITANRKLAAVGHLLQQRHGGRYMVWNISEVEYDTSVLDDQVLVYKFPGSPSPPLGLLLKLLMSMESWLKADERNVAVIHCLTGRGRTSTVLAAFLCWTGEAGFTDVNMALEYIAQCKRISVQSLTIPSQLRYASYFANMLDGVRPSQPPLLFKRIIMSEAPKFGKRVAHSLNKSSRDITSEEVHDPPPSQGALSGCTPYLQLFKAGNLVFTTAASVNYAQTNDDLPFCSSSDGPISFLIETVVQGDVLLRCRHLTKSGQRVSMFRAAFHTGYIPPKVLRLTKAQLDGACTDRRFTDDFFLDLIFEPCDAATVTKHLMNDRGETEPTSEEVPTNEAVERRSMGTAAFNNVISASSYDTMLHRDSRFWDVISKRREENMLRQAELNKNKAEVKTVEAPLFGPTIGRRRHFVRGQQHESSNNEGGQSNVNAEKLNNPSKDRLGAFSIGEDFGLNSPANSITDASDRNSRPIEIPTTPQPKEKDALMEALMDLDDDLVDDEGEVMFEGGHGTDTIQTSVLTDIPNVPPIDEVKPSFTAEDLSASETKILIDSQLSNPASILTDMGSSETKIESYAPSEASENAVDTDNFLHTVDQLDDEIAGLNVGGLDAGFGDANFDDFDDLDNDADLEDLENFLTKSLK